VNKLEEYPRISVIICALNEEQNLPCVLPKIPKSIYEVLLVDGHSQDKTVEVARQLRPDIHILYQPGKGKGDALKYGVQQATGDIIVTLDADGATNPKEISGFIQPLLDGYDLIKGSRLAHGRPVNMPRHRWLGNKILATTFNILYGARYTDICSGYNAFWKSVFQRLKLNHDGFEMEQAMIAKAKKAGFQVAEVTHHDAGRLGNYSKVSGMKQGFINWWIIVRERFRG